MISLIPRLVLVLWQVGLTPARALNPLCTHLLGLFVFNVVSRPGRFVSNIFSLVKLPVFLSDLAPPAYNVVSEPLAFSESSSWDAGLTNRTTLTQSRKALPFRGLLVDRWGGTWEPWTRIGASRGGERTSLFWHHRVVLFCFAAPAGSGEDEEAEGWEMTSKDQERGIKESSWIHAKMHHCPSVLLMGWATFISDEGNFSEKMSGEENFEHQVWGERSWKVIQMLPNDCFFEASS